MVEARGEAGSSLSSSSILVIIIDGIVGFFALVRCNRLSVVDARRFESILFVAYRFNARINRSVDVRVRS